MTAAEAYAALGAIVINPALASRPLLIQRVVNGVTTAREVLMITEPGNVYEEVVWIIPGKEST